MKMWYQNIWKFIKTRLTMKKLIVSMLLLISACATQSPAPIVSGTNGKTSFSEPTATQPNYAPANTNVEKYRLHEVLFSDSLASIAKRYNISPHDIIALNNLQKPYYLEPGEVLKVPVYKGSSQEGYLRLPENKQTVPASTGKTSGIVKILPPLQAEQLQDYD